ncbi:GNAT family N-acetyltransferase [Kitasatospora sp. NBC_00315]|uniref:GNAT family N-acetyltransferase n=1 Tax=Kitasatospora sp. NBC_00315 TaxID=2975963 RepID=UPI00352FCA55
MTDGPDRGGRASAEGWELRPALPGDVEAIADLRAVVLREDLERLGRYDEHRVRQRLRDGYHPQYTSLLLVDDGGAGRGRAGCVTLRPAEDGLHLEHFYLAPRYQGLGLGSAVLRSLLARADAEGVPVRLSVLQGSAARRLYERHGFVPDSEDAVEVFMHRPAPVCAGAPVATAPVTGHAGPAG